MGKTKHRRKRKKAAQPLSGWAVAGILAAIVFLAILLSGVIGRKKSPESGDRVPPGSWEYGIDLSHNNRGPIAWDSLYVMTDRGGRTVRDPFNAKDIKPVRFVYLKATEGASFRDRDFAANWKAAGRAPLERGAYHFFRSSRDGGVQAAHFIRTVGPLRARDLPPVLDIETVHKGCTKKMLNERALQWLKAVEKHYGKKPVVYSGASFAKDWLGKEITDHYPVWVAHYRKDRPAYEGWLLWQCTDRAVVAGIPEPVDLSVRPAR